MTKIQQTEELKRKVEAFIISFQALVKYNREKANIAVNNNISFALFINTNDNANNSKANTWIAFLIAPGIAIAMGKQISIINRQIELSISPCANSL